MNKQARTAFHARRPHLGVDADWIAIGFIILVFLTGGSSRSDVASLPLLRGAAVLFGFWAAAGMSRDDWARIRTPLLIIAALILWMVIQLVPLPPTVWQGLPGRETIRMVDDVLGQANLWRPISLTPSQTVNSILAMTVPLAALLVVARAAPENYPRLMLVFIATACFSALLGFVQIVSGAASPAYLYRITNADSMVGLFANRNHHAIFLACSIMICAMQLRDELLRKRQSRPRQAMLALAALFLSAVTLLIGSRIGFIVGGAAFAVGYIMVIAAWRTQPQTSVGHRGRSTSSRVGRLLLFSPPLLLAILVAVAVLLSDRTNALNRVMDGGLAGDMRVLAWPTVKAMIETYWSTGSGFGSFPAVYKMLEPDSLLNPTYFNRAHNDWAELLISGGLPFALILFALLLWIGRRISGSGFRTLVKGHRSDYRLTALMIVLILAGASLVDYPLRVPSIPILPIFVIAILCCPNPGGVRRN